jgi:hypothetical protein
MEISTRKENGVPVAPLPPMQFTDAFFTEEVMSGKVEPTPGIHLPEWSEEYGQTETGSIYQSLINDLQSHIKHASDAHFISKVRQCIPKATPTQSDIIILLMW